MENYESIKEEVKNLAPGKMIAVDVKGELYHGVLDENSDSRLLLFKDKMWHGFIDIAANLIVFFAKELTHEVLDLIVKGREENSRLGGTEKDIQNNLAQKKFNELPLEAETSVEYNGKKYLARKGAENHHNILFLFDEDDLLDPAGWIDFRGGRIFIDEKISAFDLSTATFINDTPGT
jgi:hypothetical protein